MIIRKYVSVINKKRKKGEKFLLVMQTLRIYSHNNLPTQAHLGDIAGLVPDHCNKANITISQ